ncbi:NAD(P)-dependent oxidoreductase [Arthrobacter sp. NPDC093128]|uniref:NAD(P)-dependent oxidoreductase n=1 Tax=Arthrobacter sp. NPDC093128 TaxID=3154979 RepID=UPI00343DB6C6
MRIGFIGLGRMGRGMASNLVEAGRDVVVFDAVPGTAVSLVEEGASLADSIGDLARRSDVIFTSLPGPVQVEEVVFGEDGIASNLRPGLTLLDLSTSSCTLARRIYEEFKIAGASMLDAPVSGGPSGAASGDLVIWVGGDREAFDKHVDLLRVIGKTPCYVGAIGAGTVTKLAHNLTGFMIMETLAETFSLAVKAGLDPLDLWEALRLGLVGKKSPLDLVANQFLLGSYHCPSMTLELAHKDASLATQLAEELGVPMRLANLTLEEMAEGLGRGFGGEDRSSFLKLQLERAGVSIAVDPARLQTAIKANR